MPTYPKPDGLDQSWSTTDPATAQRLGIEVISMYLSWDSSKNISAKKVLAYHAHKIACLLNWESQAGAPLNGASQGKTDATEAVRLVKALFAAVGYKPSNRVVIYFSCDRDTTSGNYPAIEAYYRAAKAVCAAAGFGIGCYGEADLCAHLSKLGITDAEWQSYAWSGGRLDPSADFYQWKNGQKIGGASVDFDKVIHADQLGAWWAPGTTHNTSSASAVPLDLLEYIVSLDRNSADYKNFVNDVAAAVWGRQWTGGNGKAYPASSYLIAANANSWEIKSTLAKALTDSPGGLLVRVAAVQAELAKVEAAVNALQVKTQSVPVSGTLTIGKIA